MPSKKAEVVLKELMESAVRDMMNEKGQLVQNGKVIPVGIVDFLTKMEEFLHDPTNREKLSSLLSAVSYSDALELQEAFTEDDMEARLKAVAVTAVECLSSVKNDPDQSLKAMSTEQVEMMNRLDDVRAIASTLVAHLLAYHWGDDIPRDLKMEGDGTVYSATFEDAE